MLRRSFNLLKQNSRICSCKLQLHLTAFSAFPRKLGGDLPNPKLPTSVSKLYSHDTDILFEELKKAKTIEKILELTSLHLDVMNSKHVVVCLEKIFDIAKNDSEKRQFLLQNSLFQALCSRLMKLVRLFEPQDIITSYKVLTNLGIRSNTYLMQSILKMLGTHLNYMTLSQLNFLNFLLHKQRHNSLVDGLKLALPLVLQVQIDQQLDSDNITEIVNCLQLSCRSRLRPSTIEKIVSTVLKKVPQLTISDAITVTFALLNLDTPVDGYRELLESALQIVSSQIDQVSPEKLIEIIRACRLHQYYNALFFTASAKKAIQEKWGLERVYALLSPLYRMRFCIASLIDHFAETIILEKELFHEKNFSALSCAEYLTATSQRSNRAVEAMQVICSDASKLQSVVSKSSYLAVKLFSCAAMVGCFPKEWLTRILEEDYLFNAFSVSKRQDREADCKNEILALMWSLEFYEKLNDYSIPSSVIKKLIQSEYQTYSQIDYPLEKFIVKGLGGQQFLQSGVFTRDGHFIDHVVAMRIGYYPVSLQNVTKNQEMHLPNLIFAEDFILPGDVKLITILVAKDNKYFKDPEVLTGWMDLKVKCLAKKGYFPVVVNYKCWFDLPDREKIPYLMREIKDSVLDCNSSFYSTTLS